MSLTRCVGVLASVSAGVSTGAQGMADSSESVLEGPSCFVCLAFERDRGYSDVPGVSYVRTACRLGVLC